MNQPLKQSSTLESQLAFTVGNITGEGVTLVDKEYNVIQLPKSLLPMGSVSGSIIRMTLRRDVEMEKKEEEQIIGLIERLGAGEHVGDTIIGVEDELGSSTRSQAQQLNHNKNEKKPDKKPQTKPLIKVASQVKQQEKPQTGMKKKPKTQQPQQQKSSTVAKQSSQPAQLIQRAVVQRQKSASRRTSSAMKKVKPQQMEGVFS